MSTSFGLIGLGIIGSRIAKCFISKNVPTSVWNRTFQEGWQNHWKSLEEIAQSCDVISIYLKDRTACLEVFEQILPYLKKGTLILNHSTIDVATCQLLAKKCKEINVDYVDAPFTGSKIPAEKAQLVYYLGAPENIRQKAAAWLTPFSQKVIEIGEIGQATTIKLVTNLISAISVEAFSEALHITQSANIDPNLLIDAVNSNACGSPLAAFKLPCMNKQDFTTHFSLSNMLKDSVYVRELASNLHVSTPAIDLVSGIMNELTNEGLGDADYCALEQKNKQI